MNNIQEIKILLNSKADLNARLSLLPYDGTPEVKEIKDKKYLYIRKRIGSKVTSEYVNVYSEDLHQTLLRAAREARELRRDIRRIERQLAALGYEESDLSPRVSMNLDFARANMKANIYDQAILEGVATTFPQTETIIDNGIVAGMKAEDVQKILNLKHSWQFILDRDVIQSESNYYLLCHIAKLVNEGFYENGGRIRSVPVRIGGTSYVPPIPIESIVIEHIESILKAEKNSIDIAIELCLYCMRTQVFIDGNKRASVIYANHYLIAHGMGFLVIPENHVPEFKRLLVEFYESNDMGAVKEFMKEKCWKNF